MIKQENTRAKLHYSISKDMEKRIIFVNFQVFTLN